ncbi:hypothetical protein GEMRC1_013515 [Eukaryota sp. GEM-RC1]
MLSNDTLQTTDGTLETVSSPCVSSLQPTEDQPDTLSDSLFLRKPSIHFQESLLVLVNLHLVKSLIKSMLDVSDLYDEWGECIEPSTHSYLDCLFDAFFKKVGNVSDRFLEFSMSAVKVFLQSSTIPLNGQHLYTLSSINSFFGVDVRSVSLNIKFDQYGGCGSQMDTILGFKSICTHLDCTNNNIRNLIDDIWFPLNEYFAQLSRLVDTSSEFFLPHLRSFKFVAGSRSSTETFTLLCKSLMTNTTLLELYIEYYELTDSEVTTLAEVFSSNNTLKKISLSCIWGINDAYLVLFNALSKNSVIESLSTGGENLSNLLPLFKSSSLKKLSFPTTLTNLTLTELIFKNADIGGEVLAEIVNCCTGLRKLVLESKERSRYSQQRSDNAFLPLFKSLEVNTCLLELQVINSQSRKSLTDDEVQVLSKMLENNTTLLALNLDLSVNSSQFINITNGLKMNSTLLETKLSVYAVDLNCLMLIFEELAVNKLNCSLKSSTQFIDVDNGFFSFSPVSSLYYTISSEELSSLRCFLECFSIKELTLKNFEFTKESITALCDLIRSNSSLTSVEFSDFKFVKLTQRGFYQKIDHYSNLINVIQCNSRLTKVTLSQHDMGIKTLLTIFELVSNNKLTSNINVSPHLIDFSRGSIYYHDRVEDGDLICLLNALKSDVPVKSVDCKGSSSITLTGLIALFEILSFNKSVIDLDISPHLIDISRGSIYYDNHVEDADLILLLDFLKSSTIIILFDCKTYHIDTYNGVIFFSARSLPSKKMELSFISSLRCFLECFSIKSLLLKNVSLLRNPSLLYVT